MDRSTIQPIVLELFQAYFESASKAFNADPSGDNWHTLQEAMWIRQACVASSSRSLPAVTDAVYRLMQRVGRQHRGEPDTNGDEMLTKLEIKVDYLRKCVRDALEVYKRPGYWSAENDSDFTRVMSALEAAEGEFDA